MTSTPPMQISLIAAMDRNRAIGRAGGLPWNYPEDLRWFKEKTAGHAMVMGRRTFASIGNTPLPKRLNIVVTRSALPQQPAGVVWQPSVEEAVEYARQSGEKELFIAGGAEIYRQALPLATRLYLTFIDIAVPDADTFFPAWDPAAWTTVFEQASHQLTFRVLERKTPGAG